MDDKDKNNPNTVRYFITILLIAAALSTITGALGYYAASQVTRPKQIQPATKTDTSEITIKTSALFRNQTAEIEGKVTKIGIDTLTITNNKKQSDEFPVIKNLAIYTVNNHNPPQPVILRDIKSVEINRDAAITLNLNFSTHLYEVASIVYLPNIASASAQVKKSLPAK